MSAPVGDWCLIESDPGVFTELIHGFGVDGVEVDEIWSLDPENFEKLKPVHGLIFLFKWKADVYEQAEGTIVDFLNAPHIFFAKQVIQNACATQALISVLLNCHHADLKLGSALGDFKEFSSSFDPQMKGLSLSNSEIIKQVHNSFARQQMFEADQQEASDKDDVYHFVAYVPIDGHLYELDGLKEGPVDLGAITPGSDWLDLARPVLERRMQKYSGEEIRFNLLAVISDRKLHYQKQLHELEQADMETDTVHSEIEHIKILIEEEERKLDRYRVENIRRRHNYLPLIIELLKALAKDKKLITLTKQAKEKTKEKVAKKA